MEKLKRRPIDVIRSRNGGMSRSYSPGAETVLTPSNPLLGLFTPLSGIEPDRRLRWKPFNVEMRRQCLYGIVVERIDEVGKENSLHAKTIPAPLMPKPTIQQRARLLCHKWRPPWKLPVLVASSRYTTAGTSLARSSERIEPGAHLILSQPPRYAVQAHLVPLLGQKCLRCRHQKPFVWSLIA
jgi:hypothetical protein